MVFFAMSGSFLAVFAAVAMRAERVAAVKLQIIYQKAVTP
jgi:hypothetical protein